MSLFPLFTKGDFWASLRSWTFPWADPIPDPMDFDEVNVTDEEDMDQDHQQSINRDAEMLGLRNPC